MEIRVVSTGSKANCYLLDTGSEILILDAGVPVKRMLPHIRDFRSVSGCLVTHEHGDHARAMLDIARLGIQTYASRGTADAVRGEGVFPSVVVVKPMNSFWAGGFTVLPFEAQHDAAEPLGFLVRWDKTGEMIVYATDTYYIRYTFPGVSCWIIECNYCDDMLDEMLARGEINAGLRRRLLESHMSLSRLKDAFRANDMRKTTNIVLVHLSDARSDENRMVSEIVDLTGIETVAAYNGMRIRIGVPF